MVHTPSPLGRLPMAWVVVDAISALARLLWGTGGAAGVPDIYRGAKVADKPVLRLGEMIPSHNSPWHRPSSSGPPGRGAVTCEGTLKQPGQEFCAPRLQIVRRNKVHCCCRVNSSLALLSATLRASRSVIWTLCLFWGNNGGLLWKTAANALLSFIDKQHFEVLHSFTVELINTPVKCEGLAETEREPSIYHLICIILRQLLNIDLLAFMELMRELQSDKWLSANE